MVRLQSENCKARSQSRPVRVAYLIDQDVCSDDLLSSIFDEAYGRWGGRRTAIVPSTPSGIDERYSDWLYYFDADVIYSFVPLTDGVIEDIHERFAPAYLTKHESYFAADGSPAAFRISLPCSPLSSVSLLAAMLSRPAPLGPRPSRMQVLDTHFDKAAHPFVRENFGFLATSFSSSFQLAHSDILSPLNLISQSDRDNPRVGKNPGADYVHEEADVLTALAERNRPLVTLSNLSEVFAPYLTGFDNETFEGLTITVGDTTADRMAFWNGQHRKRRTRSYEVAALRVPTARFDEPNFLRLLRGVIATRGTCELLPV